VGTGAGALSELPFRVIRPSTRTIGDVTNFLDRLERMRPDVVLIDISNWKEALEGSPVPSGAPWATHDHRLEHQREADPTWRRCAPGINEYLVSPLHDPLKRALE